MIRLSQTMRLPHTVGISKTMRPPHIVNQPHTIVLLPYIMKLSFIMSLHKTFLFTEDVSYNDYFVLI